MAWFKRIWLACMLAIAAGGQAPLWLHQAVCHCSSELALAHDQVTADAGAPNACVGHDHSTRPEAGESTTQAPSRLLGLKGSHADADECLACYALSQLSLVHTNGASLGWIEPCSAFVVPNDLNFSARTFFAYGSRAPPVA